MGTRERTDLDMSSDERARHGCLVTLRNQQTGADRVVHLLGSVEAGLKELTLDLDELREDGDDWRILTVCTPTTIFRDLQGSRAIEENGATRIEEMYLGSIGRLDLLAEVPEKTYGTSRNLLRSHKALNRRGGIGFEDDNR